MALKLDKLRGMSPEELAREESELREQIWKLQMQLATGQLENPRKVRDSRRDLARVLTFLRQQRDTAAGGTES
jgi:large subunit ribosomal protein L29